VFRHISGVKLLDFEADHTLPLGAKIKNVFSAVSTPLYIFIFCSTYGQIDILSLCAQKWHLRTLKHNVYVPVLDML
jgi:hypothetical protein